MKPEDLSAMLKAEENYMDTLDECASGNARIDFSAGFRKGLAHRDAQPAVAHVNETPKIEHDGGDVLTKAKDADHVGDANKMVRLTDEEIDEVYKNSLIKYNAWPIDSAVRAIANDLYNALIKKNGG